MTSKWETVDAAGTDREVYVAVPDSDARGGVLLVHAWWGLNECFQELCDRLAREGFVVVAPDLYDGTIATTVDDAETMSEALDQTATTEHLRAAFEYLREYDAPGGGLGFVGFSLGVWLGMAVVETYPEDVDAAVLFYGTSYGDYADASAPMLGHFAEHDEFASEEEVEEFRERLAAGAGSVTFHTYPETEHWFLESDRPEYDEDAAELAWSRTVEFLRAEL